jgi:hypothetical protein
MQSFNIISALSFSPQGRTLSTQSNTPVIVGVVLGVIIVVAVVGYGYTTSSSLASMSRQNTNLSQQLSGLSQQDSGLDQQASSQDQQISSLSQQVSTLGQRTLTVVTQTNTVVSVETTTSVVTTTETSISAVPDSALIITGDSYDNATHTFTFQVQNTERYVVYAQLSATVEDDSTTCPSFDVYIYTSQIYNFTALETISVPLNLTLTSQSVAAGSNSNPACSPVNEAIVQFILPQSTAISSTYDFTISPSYSHP